jgi:hypothetical protein
MPIYMPITGVTKLVGRQNNIFLHAAATASSHTEGCKTAFSFRFVQSDSVLIALFYNLAFLLRSERVNQYQLCFQLYLIERAI